MTNAETTAKSIKTLLQKQPFDIYDVSQFTNAREREDAARLDELRRIFKTCVQHGHFLTPLIDDEEHTPARQKWNAWLVQQRNERLVTQLCDRIRLGKRYALRTLCGVIASSPAYHKTAAITNAIIDQSMCRRLIEALCVRRPPSTQLRHTKTEKSQPNDHLPPLEIDEVLLQMLQQDFMAPYRDVQYFTLLAIADLGRKFSTANEHKERNPHEQNVIADNMLKILVSIDIADTKNDLLKSENTKATFLITPPEYNANRSSTRTTRQSDGGDSDSNDHDYGLDTTDEEGQDSDEETDYSDSETETKTPSSSSKKRARITITVNNKKNARPRRRNRSQAPFFLKSLSRHRRVFSEAWIQTLSLLPTTQSNQHHRRALLHLPQHVIPKMHNPLRLADYFTQLYRGHNNNTQHSLSNKHTRNNNSLTPILALQGLFVLMTEHELEYPQYYQSLYALLKPHVFYVKHRTRFFGLLNVCLAKSQMLPAYMVAAFLKRLCRGALTAPPSGALFVLALTSNLLRKHPECACLVHREKNTTDGGEDDSYDADTDDPAQCRALESSLWELDALQKHYHPAVATLAKACGREDDKLPMHNMDDFLLHTYKSLFELEQKRRSSLTHKGAGGKKIPITFREPKGLFVEGDIFSNILQLPSRSTETTAE